MLREPAAEAHIITADLAGLVLQLMQGPSLQSVVGLPTVVLYNLHGFSCQPAGRQQLLDKLTPDSSRIVIDLSLKYLETPNACHAALIAAAGEIFSNSLFSSFKSCVTSWIILGSCPIHTTEYPPCLQVLDPVQHLVFHLHFIHSFSVLAACHSKPLNILIDLRHTTLLC